MSLRPLPLILAALLLVAAGCDAVDQLNPSQSGGPDDATGGRFVDAARGYAVTVPDGWLILPLDDPTGRVLPGDLAPEVRAALTAQIAGLAGGGFSLLAVDTAGFDDDWVGQLTIFETPTADATLQPFLDAHLTQLGRLPTTRGEVTTEAIDPPLGEAVRLEYGAAVQAIDGTAIEADIVQYLLLGDDSVYSVTLTGLGDREGLRAAGDAVVDSFERLR